MGGRELMPGLVIDRLRLHLSGVSEDDGRRLARLIADGLAASSMPDRGGSAGSLGFKVDKSPVDDLETLSRRIVSEVLRRAMRTL
jgi:hypothetical protein